jgi:hypothetical protein
VLDQFPPGSDETIVNLEAVSLLRLANFRWVGGKRFQVIRALLLEPADDSGIYRRIGIAEVPMYKELVVEG